jgi:hypothetical protein
MALKIRVLGYLYTSEIFMDFVDIESKFLREMAIQSTKSLAAVCSWNPESCALGESHKWVSTYVLLLPSVIVIRLVC